VISPTGAAVDYTPKSDASGTSVVVTQGDSKRLESPISVRTTMPRLRSGAMTTKTFAGAYLDVSDSVAGKLVWMFTDTVEELMASKARILKRTRAEIVVELEKIYPCSEPGCSFVRSNSYRAYIDTSIPVLVRGISVPAVVRLAKKYKKIYIGELSSDEVDKLRKDLGAVGYHLCYEGWNGANVAYDGRKQKKAQKKKRATLDKNRQASGLPLNELLYNFYSIMHSLCNSYPSFSVAFDRTWGTRVRCNKSRVAHAIPSVAKIVERFYGNKCYRRGTLHVSMLNITFRSLVQEAYLYIPGFYKNFVPLTIKQMKGESHNNNVDVYFVKPLHEFYQWLIEEYREVVRKENQKGRRVSLWWRKNKKSSLKVIEEFKKHHSI
jgi:hypothetical protein